MNCKEAFYRGRKWKLNGSRRPCWNLQWMKLKCTLKVLWKKKFRNPWHHLVQCSPLLWICIFYSSLTSKTLFLYCSETTENLLMCNASYSHLKEYIVSRFFFVLIYSYWLYCTSLRANLPNKYYNVRYKLHVCTYFLDANQVEFLSHLFNSEVYLWSNKPWFHCLMKILKRY